MKDTDNKKEANDKPASAWDNVPDHHRKTLDLVIENPSVLIPLMQEEIQRLEAYGSTPTAQTSYPSYTKNDYWGNPMPLSDYCRGKARYLARICEAITIPNK